VIHIGSFSKTLAPALRLGYVSAPWDVLSRLLACKNDGGTPALE
jgi:2-aminoadipate transaminase